MSLRPAIIAAASLLCVAGCSNEMEQQPRYDSYEPSQLFADGKSLQSPPAGTMARDDPSYRAALAERPEMTLALVHRGQDRFEIYCSPCHGLAGDGEGTVPARGYPHPPSFYDGRLRAVPPDYIVDVITNGHGVMYSYADRVAPADRWAIAAYIEALQLSETPDAGGGEAAPERSDG